MGLDIRLPIGLMFTLLGALLVVSGLTADKELFQRSLGININLWWGIVMLLFGAIMLFLGRRGTSAMRPARHSPEGKLIEKIEHKTGLEKPDSKGRR
jgi:hypothetical protein